MNTTRSVWVAVFPILLLILHDIQIPMTEYDILVAKEP